MEQADRDLLDRYLQCADHAAFQVLVKRYIDIVHSVSRRVTGNEELSRDVTQNTFIRLARRAASIPKHLPISAWLHRTARSLAVDCVRSEESRKRAEARAIRPEEASPPLAWERLAPLLDGMLQKLPERDQEVLILRYFRSRTHGQIGQALGLNEHAARQRVLRALEKLRALLSQRGIAATPAVLGTLLEAHGATVAPASLLSAVISATQSITPSLSSGFSLSLLTMTSTAKLYAAAAAVFLLAAVPDWKLPFSAPTASVSTVASATRHAAPPKWNHDDFLLSVSNGTGNGPAISRKTSAIRNALSQWTDEELRKAMAEALVRPEVLLEKSDTQALLQSLVEERMRRHPDEMIRNFDELKSDRDRRLIAGAIAASWPQERMEEGLTWFVENRGYFQYENSQGLSKAIWGKAFEKRLSEGPEAVQDILRLIRLYRPGNFSIDATFPENFDFAALATSPEGRRWWQEGDARNLISGWLRTDPEGAWSEIWATKDTTQFLMRDYLFGSGVDWKWLAGKISDLEPEARTPMVSRAVATAFVRSWDDEVSNFIAGLPRTEDVLQAHESLVQKIYSSGATKIMPHLEAMGGLSERIDCLERIPKPTGKNEMKVVPDASVLREKLREWGASPAQIQSVMTRFEPSPQP